MAQIVCHNGSQKCLYVQETHYDKLRDNIRADFEDVSADFQLMFVDRDAGDWMLIENQRDLDKVLRLNKGQILLKVLPSIHRDCSPQTRSSPKIGKLVLTEDLKQMVQFISQKHIERYISRRMAEKMMKVSDIMLEQKVPASRTTFSLFSLEIEKRLAFERPTRKIARLSPEKTPLAIQVQKAVKLKLQRMIPKLIDSATEQIERSCVCKACLRGQLQLAQLMNKELLKKIKANTLNPQE